MLAQVFVLFLSSARLVLRHDFFPSQLLRGQSLPGFNLASTFFPWRQNFFTALQIVAGIFFRKFRNNQFFAAFYRTFPLPKIPVIDGIRTAIRILAETMKLKLNRQPKE
jgi:hypothetical protein